MVPIPGEPVPGVTGMAVGVCLDSMPGARVVVIGRS